MAYRQTWSHGAHSDTDEGEVPGDGERHADDGTLTGRIGGLANLSIVGSDAGSVYDHAASAILVRVVFVHQTGRQADHVECSQRVHLQRR